LPKPDTDSFADGYSNSYVYTYSNGYVYAYANIRAEPNANGDRNSDGDSYGDAHLHAGRAPGRLRDDVGLRPERLEPDSSYQHG
jgi:hypothetical protein